MSCIEIQHTGVVFRPNSRRVLVRPFISSDDERVRHIIDRAIALTEVEICTQLDSLRELFATRHPDLEACWRRHFTIVERHLGAMRLSSACELYIGALFSGEYALESAALFNPSIVPHPDQQNVGSGEVRFILSLRATGEGHISSIEFRSGILRADGSIRTGEESNFAVAPEMAQNPTYRKSIFVHKLAEMGFGNRWSQRVMASLGDDFSRAELEHATCPNEGDNESHEVIRTRECVRWLAESNYQVHFHPSVPLSQRVIFPVSPNESNGIEDARFVRFCEDDGTVCYYATYTAYNGRAILPQLIETTDFLNFRVLTLNGRAVQNKGMALFPRRVGGRFAMISRQDDENLYLMFSDNLHFWDNPRLLKTPSRPWESVKIGNCGSPIETPDGWLVITHGVGPMRRYCIGVLLLDIVDPSQVIGSLQTPLLEPQDEGREGYVPNVVYSCGAMVHGSRLILPYALSDTSSTIATVDLASLMANLKGNGTDRTNP
ncbi:MAG TPA: glycoside hydrolase family 130 protein [Chthoniobacterales bacterium]